MNKVFVLLIFLLLGYFSYAGGSEGSSDEAEGLQTLCKFLKSLQNEVIGLNGSLPTKYNHVHHKIDYLALTKGITIGDTEAIKQIRIVQLEQILYNLKEKRVFPHVLYRIESVSENCSEARVTFLPNSEFKGRVLNKGAFENSPDSYLIPNQKYDLELEPLAQRISFYKSNSEARLNARAAPTFMLTPGPLAGEISVINLAENKQQILLEREVVNITTRYAIRSIFSKTFAHHQDRLALNLQDEVNAYTEKEKKFAADIRNQIDKKTKALKAK